MQRSLTFQCLLHQHSVCCLHKFNTTRGLSGLCIYSYLIFTDVFFFPKHRSCKRLSKSQLLKCMICRARG